MSLQKTILASALIFCICITLISGLNAQQVAEISRVNSKIIVDGYADNVWNRFALRPCVSGIIRNYCTNWS
jgi:hypothetical protein